MISLRKYKSCLYVAAAILVLVVVGIIVYVTVFLNNDVQTARGAVVTNGHECAGIGSDILKKGGSAVDAAIAALFCEGVAMSQSMGLGGGFLMTIYIKETNTVASLNAREYAPASATEDMFVDQPNLSTKGGLAVAVPAELRGYWEAYNKYGGKIPWKELVEPTIDLCFNGILVTEYLADLFLKQIALIKADPFMREAYIDPKTDMPFTINQYVKRIRLGNSLKLIAEHGGDILHNGTLTEQLVQDINNAGGKFTVEDLLNYRPEWQEPITIKMPFNQTLYTTPLPGSGVVLGFMMNLLNGFLDHSQPNLLTNWQRIIESMKFGYGKRTELGDMAFVDLAELVTNLTSKEYADEMRHLIRDDTTSQDPLYYGANILPPDDHGTAHISVLAANGDAVSVTSTINLYFGAGFMSESTGIILNNQMDDFSTPNMVNNFSVQPSEANFIKPGKRPLSSMCPSIIVGDDGDVKLVLGAAGGTKITTSVALIIIRNLWYNMNIADAVNEQRLHHQLLPMNIEFEDSFTKDMDIVDGLHKIGHEYVMSSANGFSAATAISTTDTLTATSDKRRPGQSSLIF